MRNILLLLLLNFYNIWRNIVLDRKRHSYTFVSLYVEVKDWYFGFNIDLKITALWSSQKENQDTVTVMEQGT